MTIEDQIKELIFEKYGNMFAFSYAIGIPNSTLATMLKRGLKNSSVSNVLRICKALGISADEIAKDKIVPISEAYSKTYPTDFDAFVAHAKKHLVENEITLNGTPLTDEEKRTMIVALEVAKGIIKK